MEVHNRIGMNLGLVWFGLIWHIFQGFPGHGGVITLRYLRIDNSHTGKFS